MGSSDGRAMQTAHVPAAAPDTLDTLPPPPMSRPVSLPRISLGFDEDRRGERGSDAPPRASDLTIESILGEGGMGTVYLARQRSLGREVAVKCLRADAHHSRAADALLREAKIGGALEHPNIVPVHALGKDESGGPVLVMKRIEGTPWRDLLERDDHPAWKRMDTPDDERRVAHLQIMLQVCNALAFAHSRKVIHRDIKPDNVMIGAFGEVYLLDWGVAVRRVSETAEASTSVHVVGTPNYMAPEMVGGDERSVDERTDVYLLGATLHEVLTGTYRHDGPATDDVLLAAALSEPATYGPDVPAELAALCNAATHRDPAQRPASATAFRHALTVYLRHRGSVALTHTADAAMANIPEDVSLQTLSGSEAHRNLTEARFGYLQALREWSGNESARDGLDRCLERMVEREIAQRNPDAASALLEEMVAVRPALRERVESLGRDIAEQRARDERARREAMEQDSSVSSRPRIAVMLATLSASIYLGIDSTRAEIRMGHPIEMREVITIDAIILAAMLLGMVLARKSLFANRISRQMTWLGFTALGMSFLSDGTVWLEHGTSRAAGMHTLMVLSATIGVGALLLLPGLWVASGALLVCAFVAALYPLLTSLMVTVATAATLLVVIHQTLKHGKRQETR
ncbi:MAG: serine/threonine-protein kinase [Deltaproteobacteria bacterium]